jgi:hypothetical protein
MARGEVEVDLGGELRTLRFRTGELRALEKALDSDVLAHMAKSKGSTELLVQSIVCGLMNAVDPKKRPSPDTVDEWLDEFTGDVDELQRSILYAIARGKPKQAAMQLVDVLDRIYAKANANKARARAAVADPLALSPVA